jgi:hypothetical protein
MAPKSLHVGVDSPETQVTKINLKKHTRQDSRGGSGFGLYNLNQVTQVQEKRKLKSSGKNSSRIRKSESHNYDDQQKQVIGHATVVDLFPFSTQDLENNMSIKLSKERPRFTRANLQQQKR